MKRKGIILAGGTGSRLAPLTNSVSKQLLPVYNKPMIFYPLSTLMLAGIREILIITTPIDKYQFQRLLGDGSDFGISITYEEQQSPDGIAQAFLIGENFIKDNPSALVLGDNIFYGQGMSDTLMTTSNENSNAYIFAYQVDDPKSFGVIEFDEYEHIKSIEEKPNFPKSNFVVTGLYFYDEDVSKRCRSLQPSQRGELEITDLNLSYLYDQKLKVHKFGRGYAWLDTGTHDSLLEASQFIRTIEKRQGLKVGSPEEVAWRKGWISDKALSKLGSRYSNNDYGSYLQNLAQHKSDL